MLIGVSLRPQYAAWMAMREAALLVDELAFDWLLTSDHLMASGDHDADPDGPIYEAWQLAAAWAALTRHVRVGVMVSGVALRHPALMAKMAITLDHISGGRAICGIGAGWFGEEAAAYGIDWPSRAERLVRLQEQATILRSLFDEPRTTFHGRHYHLTDAPAAPKPVQPRLPLLIGGGGEHQTLRIAARHADIWNGFGSPATIGRKIEVLQRHCDEVGRDPSTVTPTVALMLDPAEPAEGAAERLTEYRHAGVRGVIVDLPPPYDRSLLERLAREIRPRLQRPDEP
jgi:alkanesulfonate monooxygenase SsuD/methylene tetrahydromethanopterin reductase-like flavin-dependent oxidoreductase (luciferase family)